MGNLGVTLPPIETRALHLALAKLSAVSDEFEAVLLCLRRGELVTACDVRRRLDKQLGAFYTSTGGLVSHTPGRL
jgi:hypothetical protein